MIYRPTLLQNKTPSCNKRAQDDVRHNPLFFHPDYTVGFGISPNQPRRLAGCTAGEELHLALKITFLLYGVLAVLSSIIRVFSHFCSGKTNKRTFGENAESPFCFILFYFFKESRISRRSKTSSLGSSSFSSSFSSSSCFFAIFSRRVLMLLTTQKITNAISRKFTID